MPQQIINLGATGSGAGGDSARTAFEKAIANFAELYIAALPGTAAQKQAARDMFGLGTAATRAVQTGPSDTTANALLANGAHGLGAYAVALSVTGQTTLDAITYTSFVRLFSSEAASGTAGAPPGASGGVCLTIGYGATNARQTYWNITSTNRSWTRFMGGGVWGAWAPEFNASNILGTVSQSGGVPTGAIIERGSNANGEYVRFADGTQICRHLGNFPANGVSGWRMVWQFPAPFARDSAVFISGTVNTVDTGLFSSQRAYFSAVSARSRAGMDTSSSMLDVLIMPGATFATADVTPPVALVAIGRWF